ncbi:hypothetical protein CDD80_7615 [Ophiocordyceps camponoti-rufipedis]|uniref:Uncharacterized protein n=1 Tax=Ophiocordyceps camponoti-rufipedis TaxID=2004952 RepID=A0A2C5YMQ8_9HYPO|nr:hypothetical protein CDD80_7615 [Ophiocordyceps camponoti-rufipedis]
MAKPLIADFVQAPSWTLINATPSSSLLVRAISVACVSASDPTSSPLPSAPRLTPCVASVRVGNSRHPASPVPPRWRSVAVDMEASVRPLLAL